MLSTLYLHPEEMLDLQSGEKYECAICDAERKLCQKYPTFRCGVALKRDTELYELEQALGRLRKGTFGVCARCKGRIPRTILMDQPTVLLCSKCKRELAAEA
jgi:hypothetical protein